MSSRTATIRASCLLLLAVALAPAGRLAAQTFDGTVFAGAALMTSDLTDEFRARTGGTDTNPIIEDAVQSHDNGIAFGAHLGARWSTVSLEGTVAVIPTDIVTDFSESASATESQTVLLLGASVLYNIPGRFYEFFLAAGGGVKSYSADDPAGGFDAGTDFMYNFGGGARIFLTERAALRADLRDYVSTFDAFENVSGSDQDAKTQHDILITVGLSYRPGG